MPLLEIKQTRKVAAICSLEESTAIRWTSMRHSSIASRTRWSTRLWNTPLARIRTSRSSALQILKVTAQLRIKKPATAPTGARRGPKPGNHVAAV